MAPNLKYLGRCIACMCGRMRKCTVECEPETYSVHGDNGSGSRAEASVHVRLRPTDVAMRWCPCVEDTLNPVDVVAPLVRSTVSKWEIYSARSN